MPKLSDVAQIATLVFCVVAVFLARRGARRKLGEARAQGARDVASRATAGVVVGDVIYNRGSGSTVARKSGSSADHSARHDDDDDDGHDDGGDIGTVTMRESANRLGMGSVRDIERGRTVGQLPSGGALVGLPSARRTTRFARASRTSEIVELHSE